MCASVIIEPAMNRRRGSVVYDCAGTPLKTNMCYRDRLQDSLAVNAAVFASVVLASRLRTNLEVFLTVAHAILWFAVFPRLLHHVVS